MKNEEILKNLRVDFSENNYGTCEKLLKNEDTVYLALDFIRENISLSNNKKMLKNLSVIIHKANVKNSLESQSLLADIYLDLALLGHKESLLEWHLWNTSKAIEIKLTRNELIIYPELILSKPITDIIFRAISVLSLKQLINPYLFLKALVKVKDEDIQIIALKLINDSIKEEIFTPLNVYSLYIELLNSEFSGIIIRVLNSLSNIWIKPEKNIIFKLKIFVKHELLVIQKAAVNLLIRWKAVDSLELILEDETQSDVVKCSIIESIGAFASERLLENILFISNDDVLLYGNHCIKSLLLFHSRTIFVKREHFDILFNIYLNTSVLAKDIEVLTYVNRDYLIDYFRIIFENNELEEVRHIKRAIEFISLIKSEESYKLLKYILEQNKNNREIRALLIKIIAYKAQKNAEDIILPYLELETEVVLDSLKYIATQKTYMILYERLGFSSKNKGNYNFLYPFYKKALTLLWHLTENKEQREDILLRINPTEIPKGIESDLGAMISMIELNLLMFRKDEFETFDMIITLCNYGLSETIPLISELLIKYVEKLSTDYSNNIDNNGEFYSYSYYSEAVVSDKVKMAIINLGKTLYKKGKIRPVILAYANSKEEAGDFFVSEMVISIIKDNELSSAELRILLEILESVDYVKDITRIKKLINHESPDVRKMLIRSFVKQDTIGFLPVFKKLINSDDIETVRQAIIAIAHFEKTSLTKSIVDSLEHRNMNIKKTAAKALRNIKDDYSVERLIFWLGYHDNNGFRSEILLTLESIYGSFLSSIIISFIEESNEKRRQQLLILALDNKLNINTFKNLLKIKNKTVELIINALYKGEIGFKNGSISTLNNDIKNYCKEFSFEPELNYVDKQTLLEKKNIENDEYNILVNGWSIKYAKKLLKLEKKSSEKTDLILKAYLKEWLDFTLTLKGDEYKKSCLFLADFDLLTLGNKLHYGILSKNYDVIIDAIENEENIEFNHKLIKLLTLILPNLNHLSKIEIANKARKWKSIKHGDGQSRYNLLKSCGVLFSPSDILICIKDCLFTSNPELFMKTILKDAFKVKENYLICTDLRNPNKALLNYIDLFVSIPYDDTEKQNELLNIMENFQPLNTSSLIFNKSKEILKTKNNKIQPSLSKRDEYLDLLLNKNNGLSKKEINKIIKTLLSWPEINDDFEIIFDMYLSEEIDLSELPESRETLSKFIEGLNSLELIKKIKELNITSHINFLKLLSYSSQKNIEKFIPFLLESWKNEDELLSQNAKKCLKIINPNTLIPFVYESLKNREFSVLDVLSKGIIESMETDEIIEIYKKDVDDFYLNKFLSLIKKRPIYSLNDKDKIDKTIAFENFKKKTSSDKNSDIIDTKTDIFKLIQLTESRDFSDIRVAIKAITFHQGDTELVVDALIKLCSNPNLKVRSLAHRALKKKADKETYLETTVSFLYDPRDSIKCSAIKTLSFAKYKPALAYIIGFLIDKDPIIQKTALESIVLYGEMALEPIFRKRKSVRPDKKEYLTKAMDIIVSEL